MDKDKILLAIREEWEKEFGHLTECSQEIRDKYYFMMGFVASAIDNSKQLKEDR